MADGVAPQTAGAVVRVIAPERPAYGASDRMAHGISFPAYADDLRQLLDHLGLPTVTLCAAAAVGGSGRLFSLERPELTFEWVARP